MSPTPGTAPEDEPPAGDPARDPHAGEHRDVRHGDGGAEPRAAGGPGTADPEAGGDAPECDDPHSDAPEGDGPLRRCALSRTELPVGEMVRFVAAPDGTVLPDIAHKLPGRGVWLEASREAVAEAQRRNVFAKSLKRKVTAPADLADRVEKLLLRRLIDALALANKAGLVVTGATKVGAALEKGGVAALFHGKDAARDGVDKLDRKFIATLGNPGQAADRTDVIIEELTIDEISLAIGRPNVVHAALRSGGATERLLENARRLRRFRGTRG